MCVCVCVCVQLHDKYDSNEEKVRIYRCLGMGDTDQLTMKCLDLVLSVCTCGSYYSCILYIRTYIHTHIHTYTHTYTFPKTPEDQGL